LTVRGSVIAFRLQDKPDFFRIPHQGCAGAPPDHRLDGAAHVDVHGVGKPPLFDHPGRCGQHVRIGAEDLGNQGPVAGIAAKIAERLPVSPGKTVGTDHFRIAQAAAVPADDGPEGKVRDPRQGGHDQVVGEVKVADFHCFPRD
jgi:hypothetical protein